MYTLKILATLVVGLLVIWGYWHEDKVVEFESLLWKAFKKFIKGVFSK